MTADMSISELIIKLFYGKRGSLKLVFLFSVLAE